MSVKVLLRITRKRLSRGEGRALGTPQLSRGEGELLSTWVALHARSCAAAGVGARSHVLLQQRATVTLQTGCGSRARVRSLVAVYHGRLWEGTFINL